MFKTPNPKGTINNAGKHTKCGERKIEYGILGGRFWYHCHECGRPIDWKEIES